MYNCKTQYKDIYNMILREIRQAIEMIDEENIEQFITDLCEAEKVFFIGVGRVKLSLEAFTKRLVHLGIKAWVVGDLTEPAITNKDILVVASGSGESIVPLAIAKKAKEIGCRKIIHIGSNLNGHMKEYADYMIRIPVRTRLYLDDEIDSQQIMTSLFEQTLFIFGDIVSQMILEEKNKDLKSLWQYHANLE